MNIKKNDESHPHIKCGGTWKVWTRAKVKKGWTVVWWTFRCNKCGRGKKYTPRSPK